jgi:hypothetical protein
MAAGWASEVWEANAWRTHMDGDCVFGCPVCAFEDEQAEVEGDDET